VHMSFLNDRSNSLKSHRDFINRMLNIPFNLCDIMEMHDEQHFYTNALYYHMKNSRDAFTRAEKEYGIFCLKVRYSLRCEH